MNLDPCFIPGCGASRSFWFGSVWRGAGCKFREERFLGVRGSSYYLHVMLFARMLRIFRNILGPGGRDWSLPVFGAHETLHIWLGMQGYHNPGLLRWWAQCSCVCGATQTMFHLLKGRLVGHANVKKSECMRKIDELWNSTVWRSTSEHCGPTRCHCRGCSRWNAILIRAFFKQCLVVLYYSTLFCVSVGFD